MQFYRVEQVTLHARRDHFEIKIVNESNRPEWTISLIDYDANVGCIGVFQSEAEVLEHADAWFVLAVDAYMAKHAKYGRMPVVKLQNGKLKVEYEDY